MESIPKPHAWEIVVWQMVHLGRNMPLGFQSPSSLHPTMEKVRLWPQQGRNKSQCPESLLHIRAECFRAHAVCCGPGSCLTRMAACSWARKNVEGLRRVHHQVGERASLFPWNYISLSLEWTRCLFKEPINSPSFCELLGGLHP